MAMNFIIAWYSQFSSLRFWWNHAPKLDSLHCHCFSGFCRSHLHLSLLRLYDFGSQHIARRETTTLVAALLMPWRTTISGLQMSRWPTARTKMCQSDPRTVTCHQGIARMHATQSSGSGVRFYWTAPTLPRRNDLPTVGSQMKHFEHLWPSLTCITINF